MGLYDGNIADYYNGLEDLGGYQFIGMKSVIANFKIGYVGEDKIISKINTPEIKFHVMRGMQELSYDTFKSCKDLELEVPNSLKLPLPHDYVNYVKISWIDSGGHCHTINECKACPKDPLSYEQTADGGDGFAVIKNRITKEDELIQEESTTWQNLQNASTTANNDIDTYKTTTGARYGLDPQHANVNGCFWISCRTGQIYFDSNLVGKTVTIQYISDSIADEKDMVVHKFAEEALYKHVAWAILNTRSNVDRNIVNAYKKERFAAIRNAKIRLSNIKLEELTQILRGKSKWIKH